MLHEDLTVASAQSDIYRDTTSSSIQLPPATISLKRSASTSFPLSNEDSSRKRMKQDHHDDEPYANASVTPVTTNASDCAPHLADDLAQELQCGCCSELVYRPVLVLPCQHFFCGSCCVLWIRNGGTNCPSCRGVSTSVVPFRMLQSVIDTLVRDAPHKARTERERQQADEIYRGSSLRIPAPREASPEPDLNESVDFARPCPHCSLSNPYGWRCPHPIADPNTDPEHAWRLDDGLPPGHAHCGNCENLLAVQAPTTTKCDLCKVSFCGIGVQSRCVALPFLSQQPHGMSDIGDLIQSPDVYECFEGNTVEVEIMFDYITAQGLSPRHIYREIATHVESQPRGFASLVELDLFADVHGVAPAIGLSSEDPPTRTCRQCAAEVLLWGLREWWVRERQKGFLEESVVKRKDCPSGWSCDRQKDLEHAREFNHVIVVQDKELETPSSSLAEPEVDSETEVTGSTPPGEFSYVSTAEGVEEFQTEGTEIRAGLTASVFINANEAIPGFVATPADS